jgi:hypothetical protein
MASFPFADKKALVSDLPFVVRPPLQSLSTISGTPPLSIEGGITTPFYQHRWNRALVSPRRTRFDCGETHDNLILEKCTLLGHAKKKAAPSKYGFIFRRSGSLWLCRLIQSHAVSRQQSNVN